MRSMRAVTVVLCAVVCLGSAGKAVAGQFHVYSCRTPAGAAAPVDGWTGSTNGSFAYAEDKCAKAGALMAALGDGDEHEGGDVAAWSFSPPSGLKLTGGTLWRAGNADGGVSKNGSYEFWLSGPADNEVFEECVYGGASPCQTGKGDAEEPLASSNRVVVPSQSTGGDLFLSAACFATLGLCKKGEHDANGYAAVVYLYAADLTLEQTTQPTVANVTGELATAETLSGTADVSFEAGDAGSGVYQAVFSVDGAEVGRTVIDENGGHCRDVGGTSDGLPAFLYLQPCASSVNADVPFDTTGLTDGSHHLVVAVTDAAGNSTVALDRKIDVANHPAGPLVSPPGTSGGAGSSAPIAAVTAPANGTPASAAASLSARWAATAHRSLTARFGAAQRVSGRLLAPGGQPIGGAWVQAQFVAASLGARAQRLASIRTGADGRFALRLPRTLPSGRLTLSYGAHEGQVVPDVTAVLTLVVPASLRLRVAPRRSHAGGTIRFAGTLRGVSLPRGGKQIVLEARTPHGAWRQFRVLDTSGHGTFRSSYRFRLPGPVTYQFRAVSPREADFPYGAGESNVVGVRER